MRRCVCARVFWGVGFGARGCVVFAYGRLMRVIIIVAGAHARLQQAQLFETRRLLVQAEDDMRLHRELRDAAGARLAGVQMNGENGGRVGRGIGDAAGGGVAGDGSRSVGGGGSGSSERIAPTVSLGQFTAEEQERLSHVMGATNLDARDKSHYRAFDEVGGEWGLGG